MRCVQTNLRVLRQFVQRARSAMLGKVLRGCAQHRRHPANPRRHQPRIRQLRRGESQRNVDVLLQQIGHARRKQQVGLDIRVLLKEARQCGHHEHLPEAGWRMQTQRAAGCCARGPGFGL